MACLLLWQMGVFAGLVTHGTKEVCMKRVHAVLGKLGLLALLGVSVAGLAMAPPAQAGNFHLSIGIGIPVPVAVVPAPVIVAPPPVIVQPAPVIAYPPSVVIAEPYIARPYFLPPGLAKKYYGRHPGRGHRYARHW